MENINKRSPIPSLPKAKKPTDPFLSNKIKSLNDKSTNDFNNRMINNNKQIMNNNRKDHSISVGGEVGTPIKLNPILSNVSQISSSIMPAFIDIDEDSSYKEQQALGNAAIASGNPWLMAGGSAWNLASNIDQALGINLNTLSKGQSAAAGVSNSQRLLNKLASLFPGTGLGVLAGETNNAQQLSQDALAVSGGFGGSIDDINSAQSMGGNRYLFGKNKINSFINEANKQNELMADIGKTNTQRKQSDYALDINNQNINRYAGHNYNGVHVGKNGIKLASLNEIHKILELQNSGIQSFQKGGTIGVDSNIIPEGQLHARLHHLEETNPELEDVTKKGIPVITVDDNGEIEQVAEIEHSEIILRLEITQKLEELMKDGSDEAAIEAGKILAEEIIVNTDDKTEKFLDDESNKNNN